jgi:NTP pyrophosphatase (non-canonical NTP hydrolase)
MENSIDKLTEIQKEVGYERGKINNVALLGLFGEAGEVLNETKISKNFNGTGWWFEEGDKAIAVSVANKIDTLKKAIRDRKHEPLFIEIKNEENFDSEMADVLYYLNALAINRGKTLNDYAELSLNKVMKYKSQKDIRHANIGHAK